MKINEIKELETKELVEKLENTKGELAQMNLNHNISPLADTSVIKKTRRDIARMNTELRQRELNK